MNTILHQTKMNHNVLCFNHCLQFILLFLVPVWASEEESRLLKTLFETYNKNVRPVLHYNETINVRIKHTVSQILDIEERKEIFVTSGWSSLRWIDSYLSWDPGQYNGIMSVNLSPGMIWLPDIMLYDDFKTDKIFGSTVDQSQNRLTINHRGQVTWGLKATFVTKCHFDISYFPFDTQSCPFRYGSWSHEKGRIDLSPKSEIKVDYLAQHSGWEFLNHSIELVAQNYTGGTYEFVIFRITFKRRAILASVNLVMPPITIGTLVLLTFVLPAASGERLALSITLLLAMIYFIIHVANLIPKDNISIPVIYKFFIATLGEIVFQIVSLIFGMQLYYKKSYDPPMPQWLKKIFLNKLSYWLGTRTKLRFDENRSDVESLDTEEIESCIELGFMPKEPISYNKYENTIYNKSDEKAIYHNGGGKAVYQNNRNRTICQNGGDRLMYHKDGDSMMDHNCNQKNTYNNGNEKTMYHNGNKHFCYQNGEKPLYQNSEKLICNEGEKTLPYYNNEKLYKDEHDNVFHSIPDSTREAIILKEWRIVALTYDRCLFLLFSSMWLITMFVYFIKVTWQS